MAKAPLFSQTGAKAGEIELPDAFFAQPVNEALLHEAVVIHQPSFIARRANEH